MQNPLVKLMSNQAINRIVGETSRFYIQNRSTILSVGGIGLSIATTSLALKNGAEIHRILLETREALSNCNTKEEKNQVYTLMLKELFPRVAPIIIFEGMTIGCFVLEKKHSDELESKLVETAGALSIAQTAIAQYQSFQKEAQESLGEERYNEIQDEIYKNQDIDCRRFTSIASEGAPGEQLFVDKYTKKPFWSSFTQIEYAAKEMSRRLGQNGTDDNLCINDFYNLIGNPDLEECELGKYFGYLAGEEPSVHFSDTHVVFPNGTRVQAAMVHLCPEPEILPESDIY